MQKPLLIFGAILIFKLSAIAQKPKIKFGQIDLSELSKTKYEIDSTADAIVLYEKAETSFGHKELIGFYTETTIHIRKKILKPSAFDQGIISIPYYVKGSTYETISNIEGNTYSLENGGLQKYELTKKSIFDEKKNEYYQQKKINLTNIKEGSIIEYKYTKITPFNIRDKPPIWYFQGNNPTLWSEYEIIIPEILYYQMILGGYLELYQNSKQDVDVDMGHPTLNCKGIKYDIVVKDAPAFKDEPFISDVEDYISKIEFELSQVAIPGQLIKNYSISWENLETTLLDQINFGLKLKKNNYLSDLKDNFKPGISNKDKLSRVFDYMTKNFVTDDSYNSIYVGDLKKVFDNKKGTASELNMMMTVLLRELDFDANPVILSTRDNGKINTNYALIDRFNYDICHVMVEGTEYLIDISNPYLKLGMLPEHCLNGTARLISPKGGKFIVIKPTERYRVYNLVNATIDPEKSILKGSFSSSGTGYYAFDQMSNFKKTSKEQFKETIQKDWNEFKIGNININNYDNKELIPSIEFSFLSEDQGITSERIYLNPMTNVKLSKNPLKNETRNYPLDFGYTSDKTYKFTLDIPKDFEVESLPKQINIALADKSATFIYSCVYNETKNQIEVLSRINFKNEMYFAEQYHELKELYNTIISKHDEQIVLKHK